MRGSGSGFGGAPVVGCLIEKKGEKDDLVHNRFQSLSTFSLSIFHNPTSPPMKAVTFFLSAVLLGCCLASAVPEGEDGVGRPGGNVGWRGGEARPRPPTRARGTQGAIHPHTTHNTSLSRPSLPGAADQNGRTLQQFGFFPGWGFGGFGNNFGGFGGGAAASSAASGGGGGGWPYYGGGGGGSSSSAAAAGRRLLDGKTLRRELTQFGGFGGFNPFLFGGGFNNFGGGGGAAAASSAASGGGGGRFGGGGSSSSSAAAAGRKLKTAADAIADRLASTA